MVEDFVMGGKESRLLVCARFFAPGEVGYLGAQVGIGPGEIKDV